MSGTFPTSPGFTATNFRINTPNQFTETFGGKIRRTGLGTSYYSFTCKFPPMTRSQAGPVIGFVAAQSGMLDSFQIFLPDQSYPTAGYTGTVTVVGTYAAGVKQVTVSSSPFNQTILRAGDYFKFTGPTWTSGTAYTVGQYVTLNNVDYVCTEAHTSGLILDTTKFALQTKVYMCTANCTTTGGSATLFFSGSLLQPLPNGARVNVTAVPFTVMLARDVQEYETGIGRFINMELDMRESF